MAGFFRRTNGWHFWSEFLRFARKLALADAQNSAGDITKLVADLHK
jgi:hypothetical protein